MAESGFYCPNPKSEPDSTRCFACCKELDGWEIEDSPNEEHFNHSNKCLFLKYGTKDWKKLTIKEYALMKTFVEKNILTLLHKNAKKQIDEKLKLEYANELPQLQNLK